LDSNECRARYELLLQGRRDYICLEFDISSSLVFVIHSTFPLYAVPSTIWGQPVHAAQARLAAAERQANPADLGALRACLWYAT
jgi:hypothetical protein